MNTPTSLPTIPEFLLEEARHERAIVGYVKPGAYREPIVCDGAVVGFYSPHQTKWGLSFAPVYVTPAYRRRGLCLKAYTSRRDVTMWAFAADWNVASREMLLKAGFKVWRRGNRGFFYRRVAQ